MPKFSRTSVAFSKQHSALFWQCEMSEGITSLNDDRVQGNIPYLAREN